MLKQKATCYPQNTESERFSLNVEQTVHSRSIRFGHASFRYQCCGETEISPKGIVLSQWECGWDIKNIGKREHAKSVRFRRAENSFWRKFGRDTQPGWKKHL